MVAGIFVGALASAVLATGSGGTAAPDGYWMKTDARFAPPTALVPSAALTYDMSLVPAAAHIQVSQHIEASGATTVRLKAEGLKPGYAYGVHVHQKPCAADPAAAGGHYQHTVDPVQPSKDPAYANAENEVWLDFKADAQGAGEAVARHGWGFRRDGATSVVLHDEKGMSGSRVGCFTVPFGWVTGTG
ncbi:superoxide dismutase family protein [Streptomyces sp. NBC_00564]|uniref:superoxide dismutase family protein n=1 Tax=unclassified Streptomyces TaxID=2593676 RepID=UPI00324792DA|nr:superoxide dismutase family protein [Streptomyces sp. NBC_00564]